MNLLKQFGILIALWLLGEILSSLLHPIIVIPGAIMGMMLLFLSLTTGILKEDHIKGVADWLLGNIAFFFVPASVGLLVLGNMNPAYVPALIIIGVLATAITMLATAFITHWLTSKKGGDL